MLDRLMIALCLIAPGAAMAQLATTQPGPAKAAPALTTHLPDRGKPVKMIVTVVLPPLPDAWVTLEQRPRWWVTRTAPVGLPGAPPSLFVSRSDRMSQGDPCESFTDRIDPTAIRAHGFRLRGISYVLDPVPSGTPTMPTWTRLDGAGQPVLPGHTSDTVTIVLPTQPTRLPPASGYGRASCRLAYRVSVVVQGPRGVDPMTGARTGD